MEATSKQVKVRWPDSVTEMPVIAANLFALQATPDGVLITFAQATPPIPSGATEEEQRASMEAIDEVAANPLFRILVTPQRLQELMGNMVTVITGLAQAGLISGTVVPPVDISHGAGQ